jgi:tripartite-type tricarboxylate transporter receptor subunit TctC
MGRSSTWLVLASLFWAYPSQAADTVRIVVPYVPAGTADIMARLIAPEIQSKLGSNVVIENRGGAGGAIGNEVVARATPDGSTLLLANMASHVLGPALRPPTIYDQSKAFEPIARIGAVPVLLAIRPQIPANNLRELIAWAKTAAKFSYGSAGSGTAMNVAGEMLNAAGALKAQHVPYRGAAPALNDLIGGHIDFIVADVTFLLPSVKSGAVRPIAIYANERSPLVPDVPTAKELGHPEMLIENWYGVFVPAGTPGSVKASLEKMILEVVALPAIKQQLLAAGMLGPKNQAEFSVELAKDFAHWAEAIRKYGITGG